MYTSVPDDYHLDSPPDVRPGSPRSDRIVAQLTEMRSDNQVTRIVSFDDQQVGWEMTGPEEHLPPPLRVHDLAATALVFLAVHQGRDLHIDGPVTQSLLRNMEDLIACWHLWRPDLYRIVRVSAEHEVTDSALPSPASPPRAVLAFSGGLDASFTAWRHVTGNAGRRSHLLHAGDRKSTRLNSSHVKTSYAVFCLKKKTATTQLSTVWILSC